MRRTSIRFLQLPTKSNASPFEIFSLPSTATSKEIKARYYELVKIYHPDRCTIGDQQKHTKDFQAIVRAYELLSDTKKRQQYVDTGVGWTSDGAQSKWDADMEFIRRNYGHRRSTQFASSYTPPYSRRSGGWDGEFYWSTYHHPSTGRHKPVYSSNGAFISGLIFFSAIVTIIEYQTFFPTTMIKNSFTKSKEVDPLQDWQFKANIDANVSLSKAHELRQRHGLSRTLAARRHVEEQSQAQ